MEFHHFLQLCNKYLMNNLPCDAFMYGFFTKITSDPEDEDFDEANSPFEVDTYSYKAKQIYYGIRPMPKKDAEYVKKHFNEESFICLIEEKVDEMQDHVQVNFVDELRKLNPDTNLRNIENTLCNMFLKYIDDIVKKERKYTRHKKKAEAAIEIVEPEENFDNETLTEARNFCIDYEQQIHLISLCQIANYKNPLHNHVRQMYTDYNRLNIKVQKAIMFLNDIPFFNFEEYWEYRYLELFREDIKKQGLVKGCDLLYDGGKYFHRAMDYSDTEISNVDPLIFPAIPNPFNLGRTEMNLGYYIDEFHYYRNDKKIRKKLTKEPPLDWMITHLHLKECEEKELTFWMCLFILNACFVIPREYGRKKNELINFYTPSLEHIEYLEDLYYTALMALYNIYSNT